MGFEIHPCSDLAALSSPLYGVVNHALDPSLERRLLSLVRVMRLDFPVILSEAEAFKIPLV